MLKKITFRRIALIILLLLLFFLWQYYPEEINEVEINKDERKINIYLIDENDFVAMKTINENSDDILEKIKNIIATLTIDSGKQIDKGFRAIIPKGTKLNNCDLNNGLLKLDFSHEFLDISSDDEEKMIEAIVYSLTEMKEVEKIMIFVNGERLIKLPHSNKNISYLDRSYGINKVIDINRINNIQMTTIYYLAKNNGYYYVPVSFISNNDEDKINIIIRNLKSNTLNNSNLLSHLNYQVELMNYEIKDKEIDLNFNNVLLDIVDNGKLKEEVKYSLVYSIKDSLNIENVVFLVNSRKIDEFIQNKNG